jgi:hypothetical protein
MVTALSQDICSGLMVCHACGWPPSGLSTLRSTFSAGKELPVWSRATKQMDAGSGSEAALAGAGTDADGVDVACGAAAGLQPAHTSTKANTPQWLMTFVVGPPNRSDFIVEFPAQDITRSISTGRVY